MSYFFVHLKMEGLEHSLAHLLWWWLKYVLLWQLFCLSPVLVRNFVVSIKSCRVALSLWCEFVYTVQTKKQWENSRTSKQLVLIKIEPRNKINEDFTYVFSI